MEKQKGLPVVKTEDDLDLLEWQHTHHHSGLELRFVDESGHRYIVWIVQRPNYCDRGHFEAGINATNLYIDQSDGFPRYYMSLQRAKEEVIDFLKWRMFQIKINKEVINPTPSLLDLLIENVR